eukprot:CAMPEP_0113661902 /NCGR_PEP_ID=MMETSP0038_2-20120614/257_1 /TAXON_ID=2898 /ORGANISM="Cryptomonas paramecium" /LENGTH=199 /DNA_ID=CAMNT_0000576695 /DNA_START=199 /DNA_END=795 /DNA_ORIENTATION=+ /assembly_acc=CAM_ASM_000170
MSSVKLHQSYNLRGGSQNAQADSWNTADTTTQRENTQDSEMKGMDTGQRISTFENSTTENKDQADVMNEDAVDIVNDAQSKAWTSEEARQQREDQLRLIFESGHCSRADLDDRCMKFIYSLPASAAAQVLTRFRELLGTRIKGKPAPYLMRMLANKLRNSRRIGRRNGAGWGPAGSAVRKERSIGRPSPRDYAGRAGPE